MFKCEFCGKEMFKKITVDKHIFCSKHMHQYLKYGKVLDNIQRTIKDLNDYYIENGLAYFNVYNQENVLIDTFFIDESDIQKVKYHKWRKTHDHFVTGLPAKHNQKDISQIILGIDNLDGKVIDHIDGNPRNNTRNNLRLCNQGENVLNKKFMSNNTIGFIGISYNEERNCFEPEIRINKTRIHLSRYKTLKEAVYARLIAEKLLFKDFENKFEKTKKEDFTLDLSENNKKEIEQKVIAKINLKLGNKLY